MNERLLLYKHDYASSNILQVMNSNEWTQMNEHYGMSNSISSLTFP